MIKIIKNLSTRQKALAFLAIDFTLLLTSLAVSQILIYGAETFMQRLMDWQVVVAMGGLTVLAMVVLMRLGVPYAKLLTYEHQGVAQTVIYAATIALAWWLIEAVFTQAQHTNAYVLFGGVLIVMTASTRMTMLRLLIDMYARDEARIRVVIYGAGDTGRQLAMALKSDPRISVMAFVDDNASLRGARVVGLAVYGPERLAVLKRSHDITRVLVAIPSIARARRAQIVQLAEGMGLECQLLPSFAQLIGEEELVDKLAPASAQSFLGRSSHDADMLGDAVAAYRDRSVMVTGAGGSIGTELCRQIISCRARRIVMFELSEAALFQANNEIAELSVDLGIEIVPVLGSVTDDRRLRDVITDNEVDVILHAAAYKHVPLVEHNPIAGIENNTFGTLILATTALSCGVDRVILISTDKAVNPRGVMGATKRMAEIVLQDLASRHSGTSFSIVRFGNVLGSSGSVVPLFQEQIARGGPVTVTDPNVTRYFMTISEAVALVLQAGSQQDGSGLYVLDMGKPILILQLARQVIEAAGRTVRDAGNPEGDIEIQITGLRPGEKMCEELSETGGLSPTSHPKIMSAARHVPSEIEVAQTLRDLRRAIEEVDAETARRVLLRAVQSGTPPRPRVMAIEPPNQGILDAAQTDAPNLKRVAKRGKEDVLLTQT